METQADCKRKTMTFRISAEENELFGRLAKEQGITVSEFIRTAGLTLAEMTVENRELLQYMHKEGPEALQKIRDMVTSLEEIMTNSFKASNDSLLRKLDRIERIVDAFLYTYLFHTPEVIQEQKPQAKDSAIARKKKVLALID